jgi:hypothetical protein
MTAGTNENIPYEKFGFTGTLCCNTYDVDASLARVEGKANVCYGIEEFECRMREIAINDNNGYIRQSG